MCDGAALNPDSQEEGESWTPRAPPLVSHAYLLLLLRCCCPVFSLWCLHARLLMIHAAMPPPRDDTYVSPQPQCCIHADDGQAELFFDEAEVLAGLPEEQRAALLAGQAEQGLALDDVDEVGVCGCVGVFGCAGVRWGEGMGADINDDETRRKGGLR